MLVMPHPILTVFTLAPGCPSALDWRAVVLRTCRTHRRAGGTSENAATHTFATSGQFHPDSGPLRLKLSPLFPAPGTRTGDNLHQWNQRLKLLVPVSPLSPVHFAGEEMHTTCPQGPG